MNVIFDNTHIKQTILSHLQQATQSIEIAMAWFTDTDLAAALHAAVGRNALIRRVPKYYEQDFCLSARVCLFCRVKIKQQYIL